MSVQNENCDTKHSNQKNAVSRRKLRPAERFGSRTKSGKLVRGDTTVLLISYYQFCQIWPVIAVAVALANVLTVPPGDSIPAGLSRPKRSQRGLLRSRDMRKGPTTTAGRG